MGDTKPIMSATDLSVGVAGGSNSRTQQLTHQPIFHHHQQQQPQQQDMSLPHYVSTPEFGQLDNIKWNPNMMQSGQPPVSRQDGAVPAFSVPSVVAPVAHKTAKLEPEETVYVPDLDLTTPGPKTEPQDKKPARSKEKANVCLFCFKPRTKVFRHIAQKHKDEERFKKYLEMSPKDQEAEKRRIILEGNHNHNMKCMETKSGELIPTRKPSGRNLQVNTNEYISCMHCLAWIKQKDARRHKCKVSINADAEDVKAVYANMSKLARMKKAAREQAENKKIGKEVEDVTATPSGFGIPILRTTSSKTGKSLQKKTNVCMFCGRFRTKLFRHIAMRHKNEKRYLDYLKLNPKDQEIEKKRMILEGNHRHNLKCIRNQSGRLIPTRCSSLNSSKEGVSSNDYTFCKFCLAWLTKKDFHRHKCIAARTAKEAAAGGDQPESNLFNGNGLWDQEATSASAADTTDTENNEDTDSEDDESDTDGTESDDDDDDDDDAMEDAA